MYKGKEKSQNYKFCKVKNYLKMSQNPEKITIVFSVLLYDTLSLTF